MSPEGDWSEAYLCVFWASPEENEQLSLGAPALMILPDLGLF